MDTNTLLIVAGFWLVCGIAALLIANSRGTVGISWFVLGLILGPFGVLLALVSKPVAPVTFTPTAGTQTAAQPDSGKLVAIFALVFFGIVAFAVLYYVV